MKVQTNDLRIRSNERSAKKRKKKHRNDNEKKHYGRKPQTTQHDKTQRADNAQKETKQPNTRNTNKNTNNQATAQQLHWKLQDCTRERKKQKTTSNQDWSWKRPPNNFIQITHNNAARKRNEQTWTKLQISSCSTTIAVRITERVGKKKRTSWNKQKQETNMRHIVSAKQQQFEDRIQATHKDTHKKKQNNCHWTRRRDNSCSPWLENKPEPRTAKYGENNNNNNGRGYKKETNLN